MLMIIGPLLLAMAGCEADSRDRDYECEYHEFGYYDMMDNERDNGCWQQNQRKRERYSGPRKSYDTSADYLNGGMDNDKSDK